MSILRFVKQPIPVDNPPAGKFYIGIDDADDELYSKDEFGVVRKIMLPDLSTSSIGDIGDVDLTGAMSGYILEFDGVNWVAQPKSGFEGAVQYNNPITPPSISVDQNNYNPAGLADSNIVRQAVTGNRSITGLQAPVPAVGQVILFINIGAGNITLENNHASSNIENRFLMSGDTLVQADESVQLLYDVTSQRWRVISKNI